ncbi:hypothetical protein X474_23535 [Dethiosulfatarculus sandiegensis]|uniref:Uncharacterized protein n=1 Tax=Dethiosulfatarculus sandiegensis TaxID=1429043 RepID=A0A0D2IZW7_9BACT|nr:hypothetical protein X474_23535 [Dethiosulfatarculus sandiegensis]
MKLTKLFIEFFQVNIFIGIYRRLLFWARRDHVGIDKKAVF